MIELITVAVSANLYACHTSIRERKRTRDKLPLKWLQ